MKVCQVEPRTVAWNKLRAGIPTASEFDALVTPEFKIKTGEGPQTYLSKKLAEKWLGGPLFTAGGAFAMEQGTILEDEAIPWYELEFNTDVQRGPWAGFIMTDNGRAGCSPDGVFGLRTVDGIDQIEGGIEIKCPEAHTHTGYLLRCAVPKDYLAQVHFSMFVTGAAWWKFLSYRRGFPALVLTVQRDEKIQAQIALALEAFNIAMDAGFEKLQNLKNLKWSSIVQMAGRR